MSETTGNTNEPTKVYPGGLDRWKFLREAEQNVSNDAEVGENAPIVAALYAVAAELAGMNYIADGIRYALRKGQ